MRTVIVYRNGEPKLIVPAEEKNGVLRSVGGSILINNDLVPEGRLEWLKKQMKARKITPEIESWGIKLGDNGNGLIARRSDEVEAEEKRKADAEYAALPQEVRECREERIAIDRLFAAAHKSLNHDLDDNNVMRGYQQQAEANRRLDAWKKKYPREAELERAADLRAAADKQDDLASGALVYDCDGSFSPEYQQQRADTFRAKANALRAEAEKIENKE